MAAMDGAEAGPQTPEEFEMVRQLGIAAKALELWDQRELPGHVDRAQEFERQHTSVDVVAGLLWAASYFGQMGLGRDQYLDVLRSWQMAAEVADAVRPAAAEDPEP